MMPNAHPIRTLTESPFSGTLFDQSETTPRFYFQSLGSGSSGNCSLLISGSEALILDAGIGIRTFLKRALILKDSPIKPMGILITHDHGDHIRGAARIAHRLGVPIYTTREVSDTLRRWSLSSKYDLTAYLREIEADTPFGIGRFAVTAFDVPHDATRNVGFSIKAEAGTFSLITDIGQVTDRVRQAIRESNYLVFESNYDEEMLRTGSYAYQLKERISGGAGHLSNRRAGETICEEMHPGLKFVALCHLSGNNNTPGLAMEHFSGHLRANGISAYRLACEGLSLGEESGDGLATTVILRDTVSSIFSLE